MLRRLIPENPFPSDLTVVMRRFCYGLLFRDFENYPIECLKRRQKFHLTLIVTGGALRGKAPPWSNFLLLAC